MVRLLCVCICIITIIGCDCIQRVNLVVIDQNTEYQIDSVEIWETGSPELIYQVKGFDVFRYERISGGLFKCPKVELNFRKEHYKTFSKKLESFSVDTITIRLEKDFDFSKIRKNILDSIFVIERLDEIPSLVYGYSGKASKQWSTRKWLLNKASIQEFIALIDYPNTTVKAIAFEGLFVQGYEDLYPVLIKILDNYDEIVYCQAGCTGFRMKLGKYCFWNIMGYHLPDAPPIKGATLNAFNEDQINTVLLKLGYEIKD